MRYCVLLVLVFGNWCAFSQNERSINSIKQEADRLYSEEQYNLAIEYYRGLADLDADVKDPGISYHLAECYLKTFNYTEAEAYFLKVHFLAPDEYPLSLYYYALMLKYNANFDESITHFDEFIAQEQNNADLKEYVEQAMIDKAGSETAKEELNLSVATAAKVVPLNLNTEYNDYAPAVRDSTTMVVTSGRIGSNRQAIDERFGEAFTDNYYFEKQGGTWTDRTKQVFHITNTRYNDGSGSFNSKGDKYYFTVCGMDGPQCRLFVTVYKNDKWSEPVALNSNVNFRTSESKHPAVSHGGDTLVFSSNRGGGSGKFDLWMSINAGGDDNWGPAMNLGNSINTKLNEISPTFTAFPNVLFFASDGHEGYGGVDLYMAKKLSTGEMVLYNLDAPFNSNRDDCFGSFSEHAFYWSTNRPGGQGGFDVVGVKIPSVLAFISKLSLKKRNARRDINLKSKTEESQRLSLQASRLEEKIDYDKLTYDKKRIVEQMVQNRLHNAPNEPGQFNISVSEYQQLKRIAEARYQDLWLKRNGYLSKIRPGNVAGSDLSVTGILKDSASGVKLPSRKILLTDSLGEVMKITRSNEHGKFRFTDVSPTQELYLRTEKNADDDIKPVIADLEITGTAKREAVHFENVYFDFDHYILRPEATRVLDALAQHLIAHPGLQVEIFAFADDRGTSQYNLRLTQKRGQSVVDYLAQKGVDQTGLAITAKGKQEQQPVAVELQRQYNRRVEFYLNGEGNAFQETARTYILRKKLDWAALAQATGIPKEELKALNGASTDQLNAFQPVRIPLRAKSISEELFFIVR